MTKDELIKKIDEIFSGEIKELNRESFDVILLTEVTNLMKIMKELKENLLFKFDYLMCLSGVDYPPERIELVYHLFSLEENHRLCVKTFLPRENPSTPSVSSLWQAAEWHEREIYDLFGVKFEGHPDMRRILLPDDFVGYPLRKDFYDPNVIPSPDKKDMMKAVTKKL